MATLGKRPLLPSQQRRNLDKYRRLFNPIGERLGTT